MACVCSMNQIGFLLKKLKLVITLPLHIMARKALPASSTSRITFPDMKRRTESSLKLHRAVISTMHQAGEHPIKFKIIWNLMEICAICLDVGLVMVVLLIAVVQISLLVSKLSFPWMSEKRLKKLRGSSKPNLVSNLPSTEVIQNAGMIYGCIPCNLGSS